MLSTSMDYIYFYLFLNKGKKKVLYLSFLTRYKVAKTNNAYKFISISPLSLSADHFTTLFFYLN